MTDYSILSDFEINGLVATHTQKVGDFTQARGVTFIHEYGKPVGDFGALCLGWKEFDPCSNPADAWPIILDNAISITPCTQLFCDEGPDRFLNGDWEACCENPDRFTGDTYIDENPLRAAMIVFLMMRKSNHTSITN